MILKKTSGSSNINGFAYNSGDRSLVVEFRGGQRYRYKDVTPEAYESFEGAKSPGKALNSEIKPNFKFEKIHMSPRKEAGK